MAHGGPDWGLMGPKETVFGLDDMAELAVRLGSIVSFDRRGDVVFLEDFSEGFGGWNSVHPGPGGAVRRSTDSVVSEPAAVILSPNPVDGSLAAAIRYTYIPRQGGLGIESSFMPVADLAYCRMNICIYDGTERTTYQVTYRHGSGNVDVYTEPATAETVGNVGVQYEGFKRFFTWKLVADTSTGRYERLLFNGQEFDISAHEADHVLDGSVVHAEWSLIAVVSGDNEIEPVVDNIIGTQNEPIGG